MYECRVEKDSISPEGKRLVTFVITFPRSVLAEVVTHRVVSDTWGDFECAITERTTTKDISKNSASSRAIPFTRMLDRVQNDPYIPQWTLNQKGMQGGFATDQDDILSANNIWLAGRNQMIEYAKQLSNIGVHKQDCNRLLEPWGWVTQVITSSRWNNFFALRCHKAAHPAFQKIARMMYLTMHKSTPKKLMYGEWHLPFIKDEESNSFAWYPGYGNTYFKEGIPDLVKFSAARCAWTSYENHDKDGTPEAMQSTWERLFAEPPIHASPCEHQATPLPVQEYGNNNHTTWPKWQSNLQGWIQARKLLHMEEVTEYNPSDEEIKSWGLEV